MSLPFFISASQNPIPAGAPFTANSAENGVSIDPGTGRVVLGNDAGGALATLLSDREIPLANFFLALIGNAGPAANRSVFTQGRFEFTGLADFLGNIITNFIQGYAENVGAGGQLMGVRFGLAAGNELYFAVTDTAGLNNFPVGATLSGVGTVGRNFFIHGEDQVRIRAGNASPSVATDNILVNATETRLLKSVRFVVNTARTGAGSVVLRNNATGEGQTLVGASGTFTTTDGKTVTVLDGVITQIV